MSALLSVLAHPAVLMNNNIHNVIYLILSFALLACFHQHNGICKISLHCAINPLMDVLLAVVRHR